MTQDNTTRARSNRWYRRIGIGVAATTLLSAGAATASAWGPMEPCKVRSTTKAFARFGDNADYMTDMNSRFEEGATHWKFTGAASIVADNEPWKVSGTTHTKALRLAPGATAESRTMCLTAGEEKLRFFVKPESANPDPLVLEFIGRDPKTGYVGRMTFTVNPATLTPKMNGWSPTPVIWVPDALNAKIRGLPHIEGTLVIKAVKTAWRVDAIHLDPFRPR